MAAPPAPSYRRDDPAAKRACAQGRPPCGGNVMRTARCLLEACVAALALAGLAWVWPATVTDLAAATLYPALAWLPTPMVLVGLLCCGCLGPAVLVVWSCCLPVYARLIRFFP